MRIFKSFTLLIFLIQTNLSCQEGFEPNGSPHFKIFWNYNNDLSQQASKKSAFELKRVYLGYKYNFSETINGKITYDIGANSGGSDYTAYVKIAQIDWKLNSILKLSFGLIGNKQFNDQEGLWGYRYAYKGFLNEYKFGASADLGFNSEFTLSPKLKINLFVFNGEGYKSIQDNNGYQKIGTSFIYDFSDKIFGKIYFDSHPLRNANPITNSSIFLGYKESSFRLGIEYGKIKNGKKYNEGEKDHNRDGYSIFATKNFENDFEIYVRFDSINSNVLPGQTIPWNTDNDGRLFVFGAEYEVAKGVKFNLNYRNFNYENPIVNNKSAIFLNAEFKL